MRLKFLLSSLLLVLCFNAIANAANPVYVYSGYITANNNRKIEINLNILIDKDSTVRGLYYYKPQFGSLKLTGEMRAGNIITLAETTIDGKVTGSFSGKIDQSREAISGIWKSNNNRSYPFYLKHQPNHSYWGYIRRFNNLKEYTVRMARWCPGNVERLNMSNQGLKTIDFNVSKMRNMTSFVFMANELKYFPVQLTRMTKLEEISFASNNLVKIPPEISRLQNLGLLYIDFNHIVSIPKKIGDLHNLLYLDISHNRMSGSLPDEIGNLYQLQELHAEFNAFSDKEKQRIKKLLPNCEVYF